MATWSETVEDVVRMRGSALVAYGYLLTGNRRDAEDLFHDAVVKTFSRGRGAAAVAEAEAYVRRTMFTLHIDAGRRETSWRKVFHLFGHDHGQRSESADVELRTDLERALQHLTPRERACTVLRFYDDLTASAIGHELGISEGAVRRYLADAATKLRQRLGDDVTDLDPSTGVSYAQVQDSRHGKKARLS